MHVVETTIRLQHTDAAGIVFFARYFDLAHAAHEAFVEHLGHPLRPDLVHADPALPLVHAATDYRAPLRLGDRVRIEVEVVEVASRKYTLRHRLVRARDGVEAATVTLTQVAVDAATGRATHLPADLAEALRRHAARAGPVTGASTDPDAGV